MNKYKPALFIASGAALWGSIALFVRELGNLGFSAMEIVAIRVISAAFFLFFLGVFSYRKEMQLSQWHDIRYFIGTGILSIVFFNFCYFTTMNQAGVSVAVILLYTAPAFVTVLSFFFLKEKIDRKKLIAVFATILGCALITGLSGGNSNLTAISFLIGLGSGLGYALYTIFGKFALRKYSSYTVTFYTFLVASVALVPFTRLWEKIQLFMTFEVLLLSLGLGLIPTVVAYILYTKGLEQTEGSKAAIIATIEPVVACVIGVAVFGEFFGNAQVLGAVCILGSVIAVNINSKKLRVPKDRGVHS
ncbi:DMT family transporter [Cytobacillus gottheilii]|uniref:EamA family transporter n=2 Tax=Cytobacillus gottheilii TaxID=859144 RepID=A0ABX8FID2_9BACI|nr:EamA family transporter [Cytobacillus gottheilii]QVY63784.1 EamA family transporter [Cytobacillus gottheilii]